MEANYAQKTMGDLYDLVAALLTTKAERAVVRRELYKLMDAHGALNVAWVLGVVKDDMTANGGLGT